MEQFHSKLIEDMLEISLDNFGLQSNGVEQSTKEPQLQILAKMS